MQTKTYCKTTITVLFFIYTILTIQYVINMVSKEQNTNFNLKNNILLYKIKFEQVKQISNLHATLHK